MNLPARFQRASGAASPAGPRSRAQRRRARDWLSIATVAIIVLSARSSLADHYVVPSGSMIPSVEEGDRVLVDKAAFGLRVPLSQAWLLEGADPAPGDVVVFESPADGEVLLKRVAAVPGDWVAVREGRLVRNGALAAIDEPAGGGAAIEVLAGRRHPVELGDGGPDFGPVRVPARQYLMIGDNRGNSHDGRMFGWVPRAAILGRVVGVFHRRGSFTWVAL